MFSYHVFKFCLGFCQMEKITSITFINVPRSSFERETLSYRKAVSCILLIQCVHIFFPFWYSFYPVTWTGTFFSKSVFIFKYLLLKMCISLISYLARTWGNCWPPLQSFSFFGWLFSSLKSYQNRQYTEFSRYNKVMRIWWFLFCTGEEFVCSKFPIFWFTNVRRGNLFTWIVSNKSLQQEGLVCNVWIIWPCTWMGRKYIWFNAFS